MPAKWLPAFILRHKLEHAAMDAERAVRALTTDREVRRSIACTYLGRQDDVQEDAYEPNPERWPGHVNDRRSHVHVTFRWRAASDQVLEQDFRVDHACERGLRLPTLHEDGSLSDPGSTEALRRALEEAAQSAAEHWSTQVGEEFGRSFTCRSRVFLQHKSTLASLFGEDGVRGKEHRTRIVLLGEEVSGATGSCFLQNCNSEEHARRSGKA